MSGVYWETEAGTRAPRAKGGLESFRLEETPHEGLGWLLGSLRRRGVVGTEGEPARPASVGRIRLGTDRAGSGPVP
jgi:hypothetical protein